MDIASLHSLLNTLWVVWFFVLFGGIALWTLRPARTAAFDRARQIPLRESD